MADEEKKLKEQTEYVRLNDEYKKLSKKFLNRSYGCAIPFFIITVVIKITDPSSLPGAAWFFLFVSPIACLISAALHSQYQSLSKDTLSEFSADISALAKNKDLGSRIVRQRKTVYNNNILFYIGIGSFLLFIVLWLYNVGDLSCSKPASQKNKADGSITIDLLQINDVYEIAALDNGRIGGMARVATLKKQWLWQNENTMLLMAGDFLSPSVFNSVKDASGKNVAGQQMVEAMNEAGVDVVTFGNHEFDVSYDVLQQRINESRFQWLSSNVYHKTDKGSLPFQKNNVDIPKYFVKTFTNANGIPFNIGFFGLTVPENKGSDEFVQYDSLLNMAKAMYKILSADCDAVIALTHLEVKEDSLLAVAIPQLTAIIGGHEHDMRYKKVGKVYITKAHSNAKSVFHVRLSLQRKSNAITGLVLPDLIPIDTAIKEDYLTKDLVERWMNIAMEYFRNSGFSPDKTVCESFTEKLDGRDAKIRSGETNLTRLITDAMLNAGEKCDMAILNSGSVRVDDIIAPPVTEYSILRALPYGGKIDIAVIKGGFIKALLDSAAKLTGEGAYLLYAFSEKRNNESLNDTTPYTVAIGHYLITGQQSKLDFVKPGAPGIISIDSTVADKNSRMKDVRKAVIDYLRSNCVKKKFT